MSETTNVITTESPDLIDPDIYVDDTCLDVFTRARQIGDVFPHPDPTDDGEYFWAATTYRGVRSILGKHTTFTSGIYEAGGRLTGGSMFETYPRSDIRGSRNIPQHLDLPIHTEFKKFVAREFMERQIEPLMGRIKEVTQDAMRPVLDKTECDFVHDIASEVPLHVLMEMLGIPREHRWLPKAMMGPVFGFQDADVVAAAPGSAEELYAQFREMLAEVCEQKRREPQNDLLTTIAHAEIHGRRMTLEEITEFVTGGLVGAGFDTTLGAMSMGLARLLSHPDQLARLQGDMSLMPSAIDEMLRYDPPVRQERRNCRERTEIGGHVIEVDEKVIVFISSANHDPTEFPSPEKFDIGRQPNRHLSFGHGLHRCLGTHLARAEFTVMMHELLTRFESIEPAGNMEKMRGIWVGGMKRVPIRYRVKA